MCMAIAWQEVSIAKSKHRKQAFARGARERKETCNNEMSLSNRRKKLMGFLRMDLSP